MRKPDKAASIPLKHLQGERTYRDIMQIDSVILVFRGHKTPKMETLSGTGAIREEDQPSAGNRVERASLWVCRAQRKYT
jgi:hypothetical protein